MSMKAKMINEARMAVPARGGPDRPAGKAKGSMVGNETKADMAGALGGKPTDKNPLRAAGNHLRAMHPKSGGMRDM